MQRLSDGNWRSAWPRCWAEKPLKAVEFDALLAPQIKRKFDPDSAYTDVQTAVSPWGYNDYDARVPGAGTFAQTFYAYGELFRNDSRVYGGLIFSEGTYQWLYAGLADGNYALAYNGRPLAKGPCCRCSTFTRSTPGSATSAWVGRGSSATLFQSGASRRTSTVPLTGSCCTRWLTGTSGGWSRRNTASPARVVRITCSSKCRRAMA